MKKPVGAPQLRNFIEFPVPFFVTVGTFLVLLFVCYFFFGMTTDENVVAYRILKEASNPNSVEASSEPASAKQQRRKLQKEVLYTQKNDRLQLRLTSTDSSLMMDRDGDQTAIIEHMNGVKCWMQEELYYLQPEGLKPMQVIRYLEADSANYHYKTDQFVADNVKISRYMVPGHKLMVSLEGYKPIMKGTAKSVEFSLGGKEINFKATQLKASFNPSSQSAGVL